jgi:hypothetical protein
MRTPANQFSNPAIAINSVTCKSFHALQICWCLEDNLQEPSESEDGPPAKSCKSSELFGENHFNSQRGNDRSERNRNRQNIELPTWLSCLSTSVTSCKSSKIGDTMV